MFGKFFFSSDKGRVASGSIGSITVAELDWGNKEHIKAIEPPFDYIIGTDVVSLCSVFESSELCLSNSRSYFVVMQTFMQHATSYSCDSWMHGSVRVYCHCKYIMTSANLALNISFYYKFIFSIASFLHSSHSVIILSSLLHSRQSSKPLHFQYFIN